MSKLLSEIDNRSVVIYAYMMTLQYAPHKEYIIHEQNLIITDVKKIVNNA